MNETVHDFLVRHPSRRLVRGLALLSLALAGAAGTGVAQAGGVGWSVGIFLPPVVISGGQSGYPPPAYPPPVYGPPPVVYVPPPPVVYYPSPAVVYGPPVVYRPVPPGWRHGHGRWEGRGHGFGRGGPYGPYAQGDSDRWRDRDRDGIPNRWDRHD